MTARSAVAAVHQRREPVTVLTVTENVMLGDLPTRRGIVHWKAVGSEATKTLSDLCIGSAVKTTTSGWDVHHLSGGFRDFGWPFKEQGEEALRFYTRVKTVVVHFGA